MRAVEAAMFHEKFKDYTSWEGTKEENKEADMKIANAILSSLKHQESVQTDKNS